MTDLPLRPPRFDDLGVRRALSGRLLPSLVGAMTFLAALALAGAVGASALADRWQSGLEPMATIQVPQPAAPSVQPGAPRLAAVQTVLKASAEILSYKVLDAAELDDLLRPWLGQGTGRIAISLPAVIEARVAGDASPDRLQAALQAAAPGVLLEENDRWIGRIAALAGSVQLCGALALGLVGFVSVAVVAVATRAGLATRRDAIETVHGLGATDGYVAGRFARRAMVLAASGSAVGAAAALPVLLGLTGLAAPFSGTQSSVTGIGVLAAMPASLWAGLILLPLIAAAIGWATALGTVRRWLRRLP